jgi:hypothetical protein
MVCHRGPGSKVDSVYDGSRRSLPDNADCAIFLRG